MERPPLTVRPVARATAAAAAAARGVCAGLATYALAGGLITLVGWAARIRRLTAWDGGEHHMFVNTALGAVCAATGLLLLARHQPSASSSNRIRRFLIIVLGAGAILIGGATLVEHLGALDLGIDTLLVRRPWGEKAAAPGRMGPPASLSYAFLGIALVLATRPDRRLRAVASVLGLIVATMALLALTGHLFGANRLYAVPHWTGIAMQTASVLLALGLGMVAAIPECQPARALQGEGAAPALARRALPFVIGLPMLLGWLRLKGQSMGLFDGPMGTAMVVVILIVVQCGLLWWSVSALSAREAATRQAREAAEAASRAKDQFLAVLSHELRTPLTPVVTLVQMLQRDSSALPAGVRDAVGTIRRNLDLELRLIDDLLDLTRISRGKLSLHLQELDPHEVIRRVIDLCNADIRAKGLTLDLRLHARRTMVEGDSARLHQVLWNLLRNSIKFTPHGGAIIVATTNDPQEHNLVVRVQDTGIGIEPDALRRIFLAFEQGSGSVSRQFGGLGVGLALSRAIVEAHGGAITAQSPGRNLGSTFTLSLPLARTAAEVKVPAAALAPSSAAAPCQTADTANDRIQECLRILLVEDHADTARAMSRLLDDFGWRVRTADSVAGALLAAEVEPFDVLLCDVGLPDGSGLDLMRQLLRRSSSTQPVKGIAISGFGMEQDIQSSLDAGFAAHLVKPVDINELHAAVQQLVKSPRPAAEYATDAKTV
jgi:signal transduction histidine kinase/ActR/RegA family two-component response regulator